MAAGSVVGSHLASNAVSNSHVVSDSISLDKLSPSVRDELEDTIIVAAAVVAMGGGAVTHTESCPAGTFLRGGGWVHERQSVGGLSAAVYAYTNGPVFSGAVPSTDTWQFGIRNDDPSWNVSIKLWIICGK